MLQCAGLACEHRAVEAGPGSGKGTSMRSRRRHAAALFVAAAASIALAAPSSAGASAVTQWNQIATTALIGTAGQAPPVSVLHLAMVHGAVYDAVNAIDGSYTPYLASPPATPFDSQEAAAATA